MKNSKLVFIVLSHTLTEAQINDLGAAKIILLSDVNPELAGECRQIDPAATLEDVQDLGSKVMIEAVKVGATHFVCQGEPCLAMWANLMASGQVVISSTETKLSSFEEGVPNFERIGNPMTCLQSTTKRTSVESTDPETGEVFKKSVFKHVQWRKMF